MFGVLLLACHNANSSIVRLAPPEKVAVLTVTARQEGDHSQGLAAWLREGSAERENVPSPGVCERPTRQSSGVPFASHVQVRLAETLSLPWSEAAGAYGAIGPLQGADAAWAVGDLAWEEGGKSHDLTGLLHFGAEPQIRRVERLSDGGVRLEWDATEAGQLSLQSMGLTCGVGRNGVELPWWAVPAMGGQVVLRSVRTQSRMEGDTLVVGRAMIETVIPLDRPVETSAGEENTRHGGAPLQRPHPLVRKAPVG